MTTASGLPKEIIVMDTDGYHIRVEAENGDVDFVDLGDLVTLRKARDASVEKGYNPQHWLKAGERRVNKILF